MVKIGMSKDVREVVTVVRECGKVIQLSGGATVLREV